MKKQLLFLLTIFATLFVSCEDKETPIPPSIIDGVELPASNPDSPTFTGSPVTIKGKGFTKTSEIWFRAVTKATDDVKATVTAVTETEITFTTPDAVGAQAIVLKQDGKEQILGEMFLAKEEIPTPKDMITEIEVPALTEKFAEGDLITIKGKGFIKTDVIAFRAATKSESDVVATVTEATDSHIIFSVTEGLAEGATGIVLKRDDKEQVLGSVTIIAKELADAKLYKFVSTYDGPSELFEINKTTGVSTKVDAKGLNSGEIHKVVVIGKIAYSVSYGPEKESIMAFDFNTNTAKVFDVPKESCETMLFNKDNKLYALVSSDGTSEVATVSIVEINTTTGAHTTVYDLGSLSTVLDKTVAIASVDDVCYDPTTKTVLGVGYYETEDVYNSFFLSIDLASKKYNVKEAESEGYASVFTRKNEVYVSSVIYDEVTYTENSEIYSFDAKTLTVGAKIVEFKDQGAYSCLYDVKDDLFYTGGSGDFIDTYSFATKESKRITSDNELRALFLVR